MGVASTEMAEPSSAANPFSFKNFVTRRSVDVEGSGDVEGRVQRGGKKGGRRKTHTDLGGGDVPFPELEVAGKEGGGGTKENPFSFKTFVARKETKPNFSSKNESDEDDSTVHHPLATDGAPMVSTLAQTSSASTMTKLNSKAAKPPKKGDSSSIAVAKTNSKPSDRRHRKGNSGHTGMMELFPDLQSESSESDENSELPFPVLVPSPTGTKTRSHLPVVSDLVDAPDSSRLLMQPVIAANRDTGLGDQFKGAGRTMLSDSESSSEGLLHVDGGVLGGEPRLLPQISPQISAGDSQLETMHLMKEMEKLKVENEKLRKELKGSQEEAKQEREQNNALKDEITALKKKEAEDTKALENMVLKVEENLVTTTKRAISAEATIVKLKQEIQTLQTQLAQSSPQSVHQQYEETLSGVRDKAGFASQQLIAAAQTADQSIRDLLSGVETLKNVAAILEFIDTVAEVKKT